MSTLRLVAEAGLREGRYRAGVELAMVPGSHTYWKMPGEAGVPPVFAFNGSENVKSAVVQFPVPQRITEEGIDAFGYSARVVFPVLVVPDDPSRPTTLHVDASYAVCNKICMPGHGEATLALLPQGPGVAADLVREAAASVPRVVAELPALQIEPAAPARALQSWTLRWTGGTPVADVFPDAPEGTFFTTRKTGADSWTLSTSTSLSGAATRVPVTLVLAKSDGALQVTRTLDVPASAR